MKNTSSDKMWANYLKTQDMGADAACPKCIYFGDNEEDANELAMLVKKGIKKASSHALLEFQQNKEPLPKKGDHYIVTDWNGEAFCIIKTSSVTLKPYFAIDETFAKIEGEGDGSLAYWKKVHWNYYSRVLISFKKEPKESMIIVFEEFEKVYS